MTDQSGAAPLCFISTEIRRLLERPNVKMASVWVYRTADHSDLEEPVALYTAPSDAKARIAALEAVLEETRSTLEGARQHIDPTTPTSYVGEPWATMGKIDEAIARIDAALTQAEEVER